MTLKEIFGQILQGGPGFCQIAITNVCNAQCQFCSFPQVPKAKRFMADTPRLLAGLEALEKAGVKYLSITGGEPLLYPGLAAVLARARQLGIKTLLCTNGSLLTSGRIQELRDVGLDTVIISLDAPSHSRHDEHRGLPGLTAHIQRMVPVLQQAHFYPVASVTLSRLVDDLGAMLHFLEGLGFERVTFSYPVTRLGSSYLGFANHYSVDFTPEELYRWFAQIKELKNGSPLAILNPRLGLSDLQRQLRSQATRFPCLAGYKYFFVDWHLKVYRCHYQGDTLGPLEEIHQVAPIRDGCSACTIDCYRDPSVYQYLAVSAADTLTAWRQGKWLKGLATLFHPYNFLSLFAVLEEGRHWLAE
jgi:MoaA/NifB/PqqE/SkfB family radical SAM enzyme